MGVRFTAPQASGWVATDGAAAPCSDGDGLAIPCDPVHNAAGTRRATVFGLEPLQALVLPVFISAVVRLASDGLHGSWDIIGAVAVGVISISLALTWIVRWRARARGDREAVGQDWLLTVFVIALTAVLLIPDDTSDRAIWAWTTQVVGVVSGLLLVAREVRRRQAARRTS